MRKSLNISSPRGHSSKVEKNVSGAVRPDKTQNGQLAKVDKTQSNMGKTEKPSVTVIQQERRPVNGVIQQERRPVNGVIQQERRPVNGVIQQERRPVNGVIQQERRPVNGVIQQERRPVNGVIQQERRPVNGVVQQERRPVNGVVQQERRPVNGVIQQERRLVNGVVHGENKKKSPPNRQLSLSPPDYIIDPKILLTEFVEEEVSFAGRIDNFPLHEDVTNRTTILRAIDHGKKRGTVAGDTSSENKAILSINVYNVKLTRVKNGELLLRLQLHQIASLSYVKDDRQHILTIKYGDGKNSCQLVVIYCESKDIADKICALMSQCFKIVYTEATMQFIDDQFAHFLPKTPPSSGSRSSVYEPTIKGTLPPRNVPYRWAFLTPSSYGSASSIYRSLPRRSEAPSSSSDYSSSWSTAELLQDYLSKLHRKLTADELTTFAKLLTTRHTDITFTQFCDKVLDLFGQTRKHLMTGLWPFIGARDHANFERYLELKNIYVQDDAGYWSIPSATSTGSTGRPTTGPVLDRFMDSLHFEDTSHSKIRSLTSHSDPGPVSQHPPNYIRFLDNIHYSDPFETIP